MDSLVMVIGIGVISFFLLYFANTIDKEHYLLKLLSLFFAVGILIFIPKVALDSRTTCEPVIANTTIADNTTSYSYTSFCFDTDETSPASFHGSVVWFYRIFMAYVIVALMYYALMSLGDAIKNKRRP